MTPTRCRSLASIGLVLTLATPFAAWALIKPIRVLAPEFAGVTCHAGSVCTDDASRSGEAAALRAEALAFVQRRLGAIGSPPRIIFCSTEACERSFGFRGNASYNVGTVGIVVARRGWQPHFIRHELIHHLQGERIGTWRMWLDTPTWLIEGMAYAESQDPRRPLQEPWESYRSKYEQWAASIPPEALWSRARAQ